VIAPHAAKLPAIHHLPALVSCLTWWQSCIAAAGSASSDTTSATGRPAGTGSGTEPVNVAKLRARAAMRPVSRFMWAPPRVLVGDCGAPYSTLLANVRLPGAFPEMAAAAARWRSGAGVRPGRACRGAMAGKRLGVEADWRQAAPSGSSVGVNSAHPVRPAAIPHQTDPSDDQRRNRLPCQSERRSDWQAVAI